MGDLPFFGAGAGERRHGVEPGVAARSGVPEMDVRVGEGKGGHAGDAAEASRKAREVQKLEREVRRLKGKQTEGQDEVLALLDQAS